MNRPFQKQALSGIGRSLLQFLGSSLKWKIEDPYGFLTSGDQKPYLVTFWHNRILMIAYIYSQIVPHRQAKTLISPSRDGEWITSIIEQFGFSAIRGSTSKKGAIAFRELLHEVKKGNCDIGITPDGPRGPVYRVQPGVIRLSQLTGRPILPMTYHIRHKIELKSWDRFQIPIPLSEITLILGKPRVIPRDLSDEHLQDEIDWLQNELGK